MVKIDKLIKRLEKKTIKANDGIPIMYLIYDPTKPIPNMFYYSIHPDLRGYGRIEELSKALAYEARAFYEQRPEEIERIKELLREVRE